MHRDGAGVEQSPQLAFEWYSKAARQGHSKSQYNLAMMYIQGEGVAADNVMAYVWLMLARGGNAEGVEQALEIVAKGIGDRTREGDRIVAEVATSNHKEPIITKSTLVDVLSPQHKVNRQKTCTKVARTVACKW